MSSWSGEIQPASIEQIREGRDGKTHVITNDAGGVAAALRHLDPRLHLRYSEAGNYYVVYCREPHMPEGSGWLVGTFQECDQRIVKSIEETMWKFRQPGYSYADELDRQDDEAKKREEHEWSEQFGETAERLAHALRKDFNLSKSRIFVPEALNGK